MCAVMFLIRIVLTDTFAFRPLPSVYYNVKLYYYYYYYHGVHEYYENDRPAAAAAADR